MTALIQLRTSVTLVIRTGVSPVSSRLRGGMYMFGRVWIVPAASRRYSRLDIGWAPCALCIRVDGRQGMQQRIDDTPGFFHVVFASKVARIACHSVAEHAFVSLHLFGAGAPAGNHLHGIAFQAFALSHDYGADGDGHVGTDPEAHIVLAGHMAGKKRGWFAKGGKHFRTGCGQAFTRPNVEGHAFPPPRVDVEPKGGVGLGGGIGGYTLLLAISLELTANHLPWRKRRNGFEHLHLLVADGFTIDAHRRFHCQIGDDLENVILNYIADGAGLIVESAASLNAEVFGHRDLNAFDEVPVPERFHKRVGESKNDDIVHWLLTQVVVDAKDPRLRKYRVQDGIQLAGGSEVMAEWFFHDHANP